MLLRILLISCIIAPTLGEFDISSIDLKIVKQKLQRLLHDRNIPEKVSEWIAILNKNIDILDCLPINRVGNCYKSNKCTPPQLKVGKYRLSAYLSICRNPWKIIINIELPKLPWYAKVRFGNIVIPINHSSRDGVTKMNSVTRGNAKVLGFINLYKAEIKVDALIRWDCRKPVSNLYIRGLYNSQAPDRKYNAMFYKLKIRVELKKKGGWGFRYRCKTCRDIVNKSGTFGTLGPSSCIRDANKWIKKRGDEIEEETDEIQEIADEIEERAGDTQEIDDEIQEIDDEIQERPDEIDIGIN